MHNLMATNSERFPGLNSFKHDWTLETVSTDPEWRRKSAAIESPATLERVNLILNEFDELVKNSSDLPSGIVHCDLNSLNIIGERTKDQGFFEFLYFEARKDKFFKL